jgi:hypothetical protein
MRTLALPISLTICTAFLNPSVTAAAPNVALNANATASSYCNEPNNPPFFTPPEQAFDGFLCTSEPCENAGWNACGFAPQWIEGTWDTPAQVDSIRLNVNQSPPGATAYEIRFRNSAGEWSYPWPVQGNWAKWSLVKLIPPFYVEATGIRIETVSSPSWVAWFEVEVFSGTEPNEASTATWGKVKSIFH